MSASVFEAEARDRFLRARMLAALGRTSEAIGGYEPVAQRAAYELVDLPPSRAAIAGLRRRSESVAEAR